MLNDILDDSRIGSGKLAIDRAPFDRGGSLAGYRDDANVRRGIRETGLAFLQKPFTPETRLQKVREALDQESPRTRDGRENPYDKHPRRG